VSNEKIILHNISIRTRLGITERERSRKQKILVQLEIGPLTPFEELNDSIENTVNYSLIRQHVKKLFREESFNLLETAAWRVAHVIKKNHPCRQVKVTVKKFPYRDTEYVACTIIL